MYHFGVSANNNTGADLRKMWTCQKFEYEETTSEFIGKNCGESLWSDGSQRKIDRYFEEILLTFREKALEFSSDHEMQWCTMAASVLWFLTLAGTPKRKSDVLNFSFSLR